MKLKRLCLTGTIIVICAMAILQAATAAQEASISVEPAYTEVWQGDEFTVNITVDSAEHDIYAASYTLYFNNTLLNATSLEKGPFLTQDGNPSTIQDPPTGIYNAVGEIKYGECKVGAVPGITGYGVLTTITFQVIGEEGISQLNLSDLNLALLYSAPPEFVPVPTTLNNGRVGIAQTQSPFVICGYVFNDGGSDCNDPNVNITNLNTGKEWTAEKDASSNYYQLTLASCDDVVAGEVLRFDAISPDESQWNVTEHTVTQDEVNAGGFECNITLAPNVVINEFVSDNTTEWVELYNKGTTSVNMSGWTLKDGAVAAKPLSGTILANDYLVFSYSSGWLNNPGDVIYLNNTAANVDKVAYGNWDDGNADDNADKPGNGESAGRYPNGVDTDNDSADFCVFDSPTRGAENVVSEDTTPPASITGLDNTTYQETHINWTWTDPEDADFAKVMVYIDGTPQPDVLKGAQYYNATGLMPDTEYEIGTRTVDDFENINDTWENRTARTKPGAAPERCLGTCYAGTICEGDVIAENVSCGECLAEADRVWAPNKDTACFGDKEPSDLCLDWCPECCDCADNDDDTKIDYPADEQCTCGLDPSETTSLPPIPELATFALVGIGLMLVIGLTRFGRRKR